MCPTGQLRKGETVRLLHVVPTYLPAVRYGGPVFAVHGLCRALASRDAVEVFTSNINGSSKSAVPVDLDGVRVWYFSSDVLTRLSWAPGAPASNRGANSRCGNE
jgi:hypothetical protein